MEIILFMNECSKNSIIQNQTFQINLPLNLNYVINQTNKHGESAVHIAAGLGKLDIIKVNIFFNNKMPEYQYLMPVFIIYYPNTEGYLYRKMSCLRRS